MTLARPIPMLGGPADAEAIPAARAIGRAFELTGLEREGRRAC